MVLQVWTCRCGHPNVGAGPCGACLNPAPAGAARAVRAATPWRPGVLFVLTAIATAVVMVSGVAAASIRINRGDGAAAAAEPIRTVVVSPGQVPAADAGELERALPEMMRFVESTRGLQFKEPVEVTLLADADFRRRLRKGEDAASEKDAAERKKELQTSAWVLQGLGLLERDVDLEAASRALFGAAVAGFYDTESDDLVVRGSELTFAVRSTLVHELVHALQDQHFDIDRDDLDDRDDESSQGLTGLVEGDAVRIERLYLESLPERDQKQAEREELESAAAGGLGGDIPPVLIQLVAFPYIVGPRFAEEVVKAGGQPRLDQAFQQPPTSSEHLFHPETFLAGQPPVEVAPPKADKKTIDQGVLGELGLLLLLSDDDGGTAAARGWGGDWYVAWRDGDRTCVRTTVVMDSPADAEELRSALRRLANKRKGVTVTGTAPLTFTSCG